MFLYTGIGLLVAGILLMLIPNKIVSDPEKAEKAKKQAPILAVIGVILLVVRFMVLS